MKKRKQPKKPLTNKNRFIFREDALTKQFLEEIAAYPVLSNEDTVELIRKAQAGCKESLESVVNGNVRLLVRMGKEFQTDSVSLLDLVQEGYIGLHESIMKFDPKKRVPFAHYSSWWIKMRMMRYVYWNQNNIRLPETQRVAITQLSNISSRFLAEHGRYPFAEELVTLSGLSRTKVDNYLGMFYSGNIQQILIDDVQDEVESNSSPSPEEETDMSIIRDAISNCLDTLSQAHSEFIKDFFGLGRPAMTIKQLAKKEGCSIENIRQRKERLIAYLRQNCHGMLSDYLD